jgi:hypothetical protein
VVSRAAKLLGHRLHRDRSRTSCRPHKVGWLVLGLCPAGAHGGRSGSKEVWEQGPKSECPSRANRRDSTETEVHALMKVLIGVDPHKTSLAVAAIDEATSELLERASFPQDRTGLRSLERFKRSGSPNGVGRWRTQEGSVGTWR